MHLMHVAGARKGRGDLPTARATGRAPWAYASRRLDSEVVGGSRRRRSPRRTAGTPLIPRRHDARIGGQVNPTDGGVMATGRSAPRVSSNDGRMVHTGRARADARADAPVRQFREDSDAA